MGWIVNFWNYFGEAVDTRVIYADDIVAARRIALDYCYEFNYCGYSFD